MLRTGLGGKEGKGMKSGEGGGNLSSQGKADVSTVMAIAGQSLRKGGPGSEGCGGFSDSGGQICKPRNEWESGN